MSNEVWLKVSQLRNVSKFHFNPVDNMVSNKTIWKKWYKENQPEEVPRLDYKQKLKDQMTLAPSSSYSLSDLSVWTGAISCAKNLYKIPKKWD